MILALDGSSSAGSAALVDAGRLLREESFAGGRERGLGAAAAVEGFVQNEWKITAVVVGLGPGSYSGIRSAVAAAWGFAAGRGVPLHGVSSLLAIGPGEFLAAGDARQSQFYFAHVKNNEFVVFPKLVSSDELVKCCGQLPALPVYSPDDLCALVARAEVATPRASLLASLVPRASDENPGLPAMPRPIYLKPPSITRPKNAPRSRRSSTHGLRI